MHNRISFSHPRFILLILCFAASASAAYLLQDRLPAERLFCMPAECSLAAPAAEFALWFAASLTFCAVPLFVGLTFWRGACFGLTIALMTDPVHLLTAPDLLPLAAYAAVTLLMLIYAAGMVSHGRSIPVRALMRFLPCAGLAFGVLLL